jgi:hypothetical protein
MFFKGSRYLAVEAYGVDVALEAAPGRRPESRELQVKRTRALQVTTEAFVYEVKEGDRLDLLSYRFFRTPRKWWLICDANPEYLYPDDLLKPGNRIVIPRER